MTFFITALVLTGLLVWLAMNHTAVSVFGKFLPKQKEAEILSQLDHARLNSLELRIISLPEWAYIAEAPALTGCRFYWCDIETEMKYRIPRGSEVEKKVIAKFNELKNKYGLR